MAIATGFKPKNKLRRQAAYLHIKKSREAEKRDSRLRRKREEDKDPSLRVERHATNVPVTIETKRVWDEPVGDEEDALSWAVDVERLAKRRKLEQEEAEAEADAEEGDGILAKLKKLEREKEKGKEVDEDLDSMLDADSELDDEASGDSETPKKPTNRATSPTPSAATTTATNLELSPESVPSLHAP
jgi:ribosome production factor 1